MSVITATQALLVPECLLSLLFPSETLGRTGLQSWSSLQRTFERSGVPSDDISYFQSSAD